MPKVPDYVPPKAYKLGNCLVVSMRGTKKRKFFGRYSDLTAWDSYREWTAAWQAGKIDKNTGEPTLASSSGGVNSETPTLNTSRQAVVVADLLAQYYRWAEEDYRETPQVMYAIPA